MVTVNLVFTVASILMFLFVTKSVPQMLASEPNHFRNRPGCLGRSRSYKMHSLLNPDKDTVISVTS